MRSSPPVTPVRERALNAGPLGTIENVLALSYWNILLLRLSAELGRVAVLRVNDA